MPGDVHVWTGGWVALAMVAMPVDGCRGEALRQATPVHHAYSSSSSSPLASSQVERCTARLGQHPYPTPHTHLGCIQLQVALIAAQQDLDAGDVAAEQVVPACKGGSGALAMRLADCVRHSEEAMRPACLPACPACTSVR